MSEPSLLRPLTVLQRWTMTSLLYTFKSGRVLNISWGTRERLNELHGVSEVGVSAGEEHVHTIATCLL